ncbi:uncharacterized protein LOC127286680 isoform X1 [Leptopilina boulardi]|uniref:uncharacterized protein LOC127286680 isoform X1 n=1 Tax=Leptopilina boulardi TaxID=63433 RepID=UPI0021F516A9|nr:uncharacterized protein LOC127286680 isoform X1 [Leptopilina boulardi]XP_051169152.1 uncharacterized protein LOC127286680 isoform X1 [Leptopilina boulardi]XP_051169153.1 uncharacterized protein LOC127286680 isoform X1 [Leptopilina boulardi]
MFGEKLEKKNENLNKLRNEIISQLIEDEKKENINIENIQSTIYSFNLFMFCIHDMFMNENIVAIKFEERIYNKIAFNNISINFRNNFFYLRPLEVDVNKLSLMELTKQRDIFSIDSHFSFFIEELDENLDYFVIYTNLSVTLLRELILGNKFLTKEMVVTNRLKFNQLDVMEEKFAIFKNSYINTNNLYQFSQDEAEKIMDLLTIPACFHSRKEVGKFSNFTENEVKKLFLNKIVFAVKQPNSEELYKFLESNVNISQVPYDFEKLYKITLRYLQSHEFFGLTKNLMLTLCCEMQQDIKSEITEKIDEEFQKKENNSALVKTEQNEELSEVTKKEFISSDVERTIKKLKKEIDSSDYEESSDDFSSDESNSIDEEIIREKFENASISQIGRQNIVKNELRGKIVFLFNLFPAWKNGKRSQDKLKRLIKDQMLIINNAQNLNNFLESQVRKKIIGRYELEDLKSLINHGPFTAIELENYLQQEIKTSVKSFKMKEYKFANVIFGNENNLQFNEFLTFLMRGDGKKYLEIFQQNKISSVYVSKVLKGSKNDAIYAFRELYMLWFDKNHQMRFYLKNLKRENINLMHICIIIYGSGIYASQEFEKLYNLWFDKAGNKTNYLKSFEANKISVKNLCLIFKESGVNATKSFQNFYMIFVLMQKGKKRNI